MRIWFESKSGASFALYSHRLTEFHRFMSTDALLYQMLRLAISLESSVAGGLFMHCSNMKLLKFYFPMACHKRCQNIVFSGRECDWDHFIQYCIIFLILLILSITKCKGHIVREHQSYWDSMNSLKGLELENLNSRSSKSVESTLHP